jgi:hypothetical protein
MELPANLDLPSIDQLEKTLVEDYPRAECPVIHRFTPGLSIREIHVPAGTLATSMEHLTEHPFVLSKGRVRIISETEGSVTYDAPLTGITLAGTRRVVYAETDVVWTTFHATTETDVDKIGAAILAPHGNPLIPEQTRNQWKLQSPSSAPLIPDPKSEIPNFKSEISPSTPPSLSLLSDH